MSGDAVQPYDESDEMGGKSLYLCQSMWMARWMQTRRSSSAQLQNGPSLQHPRERASSSIFESSQYFKQLSHVGSTDITTESLKIGSQMSQATPICSLSRNREIFPASQTDQTTSYQRQGKCQTTRLSENDTDDFSRNERCFLSVLAWSPPAEAKSLSGDGRLLSQGALRNHEPQIKPHTFFEKNLDFSRSLLDEFKRTTSSIFPHKFNGGRTSRQSLIFRQELDQSSSVVPSKECINDSVVHLHDEHDIHKFLGDKESENFLRLRKKRKSIIMEDDKDSLLHDSSICKGQLSMVVGDELQKTPACSNVGFFPSKSSPAVIDYLEKKNNNHCVDEAPIPVPDAETVKLSTELPSIEALPGTHMDFSQANFNFLTKKNTDSNIGEGGQALSGLSTRVQKNMFSEFHGPSSDFSSHRHLKLRFQPQGSFNDIDGKAFVEKVTDTVATMNVSGESSDETDIMDLSGFQEKNHCSGEASSASCKGENVGVQSPLESVHQLFPEPPPPLYLQGPNQNQNVEEVDPASRWLKRLKLSSKIKEKEDAANASQDSESLWISRWCKQPPGSQSTSEEAWNLSIGAMALMGKSMKVLKKSCEINNRGPFVVWKTKQIL